MENNFSSSTNINTWMTLNKLENATGEEFERYAQFLLLLIGENYIKTRLHKDDGIDGYTLLRDYRNRLLIDSKGNRKEFYNFYSIYGPKAKTDWGEKRAKISKDLKDVISYSAENNSKVGKWFLVTNFDLKHSYEQEIASMCKDAGIEYEVYYPQKMVSLLDTPEQMYKALAFVHQVEAPERKLTDFHYHIFAQESLRLLTEYQDKSTTEQLDLVNYIIKSMFSFIPSEEYVEGYSKLKMSYSRISQIVAKYTALHNKEQFLFHQYSVKQKKFFTYTYDEAKKIGIYKDSIIYKDKNNEYTLYIKSLYSLYWLTVNIRSSISRKGTYNIYEELLTLNRQERMIARIRLRNKLA